mgnify:CR=1 FL=1
MTTTIPSDAPSLAQFLKVRRREMDAAGLGYGGRRRTPGLRREEVAQRAHISTTWYTWLEQGRGGAPSPRVLDSLAEALLLTQAEREYLFLIGLGHPPRARHGDIGGVSARLQRVLDAMADCPATLVTACWDVLAWNVAARCVLTDYRALAPEERNVMIRMFLDPTTRASQNDWEDVTRFLVATFRTETARSGDMHRATAIVERLSRDSEDFRRLWGKSDIRTPGEGSKTLIHPKAGRLTLDFSTFAVDGRPDLKLMVFTPSGEADREKVRALCHADKP